MQVLLKFIFSYFPFLMLSYFSYFIKSENACMISLLKSLAEPQPDPPPRDEPQMETRLDQFTGNQYVDRFSHHFGLDKSQCRD